MLFLSILVASITTSTSQSSTTTPVLSSTTSHACSSIEGSVVCRNISSVIAVDLIAKSSIVNLVLTDCNIQKLDGSDLIGLINTTSLTVSKCHMKNISHSAFSELKSLVSLDLSSNEISTLSAEMFADASGGLSELILAGNPIKVLPEQVFMYLMKLRLINLSRCQLVTVSEYAFKSLRYLEFIDLSNNSLIKMDQIDLESNGTRLNVSNNHWNCDCSLIWIRQLNATDAECSSPQNLAGQSILNYQCHDNGSSGVAVAVVVTLVVIGVILVGCWLFCRVRQRRSASQRQAHRYSAVYRETVEQSAQPL